MKKVPVFLFLSIMLLISCTSKSEKQNNKEALILSALIIYYLKLDSYKVSPYVQRLKAVEKSFKESR